MVVTREFDARPPLFRLTILGKLFTPACFCLQSVWFGNGVKARGGNGRLWKRCGLPSITPVASPLPTQAHWNGDEHRTLAPRSLCVQLRSPVSGLINIFYRANSWRRHCPHTTKAAAAANWPVVGRAELSRFYYDMSRLSPPSPQSRTFAPRTSAPHPDSTFADISLLCLTKLESVPYSTRSDGRVVTFNILTEKTRICVRRLYASSRSQTTEVCDDDKYAWEFHL